MANYDYECDYECFDCDNIHCPFFASDCISEEELLIQHIYEDIEEMNNEENSRQ